MTLDLRDYTFDANLSYVTPVANDPCNWRDTWSALRQFLLEYRQCKIIASYPGIIWHDGSAEAFFRRRRRGIQELWQAMRNDGEQDPNQRS